MPHNFSFALKSQTIVALYTLALHNHTKADAASKLTAEWICLGWLDCVGLLPPAHPLNLLPAAEAHNRPSVNWVAFCWPFGHRKHTFWFLAVPRVVWPSNSHGSPPLGCFLPPGSPRFSTNRLTIFYPSPVYFSRPAQLIAVRRHHRPGGCQQLLVASVPPPLID